MSTLIYSFQGLADFCSLQRIKMSETDKLKMEARQLLEEVNNNTNKQKQIVYDTSDSLFEYSFRNRLDQLRQKVIALGITPAVNGQ